MKHYIAMGGSHGCLPDNCQAYTSVESAVDGLDCIYELDNSQLEELKDSGYTLLSQDQGGAYCSIDSCECGCPWEHGEGDSSDNWEEYTEEEEE